MGKEGGDRPSGEWELLRSALDPGARKALRNTVYGLACRSSKIDARFFLIWGDEIATRAVLMDNHGDTLRLLGEFLSNRDAAGISWILGFLERDKSFLDEYPDQQLVENFKERVKRALLEAPRDDASDLVDQLADAVGIKRSEGPSAEHPDES